jgi:pilus assembly protein Flp/PilA
MKAFLSAVKRFAEDEDGITAIEYGLIAAVMATAIAAAFAFLSTGLNTLFKNIGLQLGVPATPAAS